MAEKIAFNTMVETWFNDITNGDLPNKIDILNQMTKVPTRRNLLKVEALLKVNGATKGIKEVLNHIAFILAGEFKSEFRYRYSTFSGNNSFYKQVSVASEFFSLLRQALTYSDKTITEEGN